MHCKGSITTEEQFYSHIQQHSTTNGNNTNNSTSQLILPTVCVICRQTLVSEMEAGMHARFHLQSAELAPCTICYQMYEKQELVGGVCRDCYQRHGKTSPFRSPECPMKFDNGAAIEMHLANMHRKGYPCMKCKVRTLFCNLGRKGVLIVKEESQFSPCWGNFYSAPRYRSCIFYHWVHQVFIDPYGHPGIQGTGFINDCIARP